MLHIYMYFTRMADRVKSEEGAGMAEYTLLLVLVAIALIAAFGALADQISDSLGAVVNALTP